MKKKINQEIITNTAIELLDEKGIEGVTIKNAAMKLAIKSPSLYNHIANLEDLLDLAAHRSMKNLYDKLMAASIGLEKKEALWAIASEYRSFAKTYPGQYQLAQKINLWKSVETKQIPEQIIAIFSKILQKYALSEDEVIHFTRTLRSYLHGFIMLEMEGSFGLPQDLEKSFTLGMNMILTNLERGFN